ncbi:RNA-binding protein 28, partial [Trichinella nelsoni]
LWNGVKNVIGIGNIFHCVYISALQLLYFIQFKKMVADRSKFPTKEESKLKKMKRWRLILRNLSFKATADAIREVFAPYDGHCAGFGFVQFKTFPAAVQALRELNATSLLNRIMAIDWALPKDQYLNLLIKEKQEAENMTMEEMVLRKLESKNEFTQASTSKIKMKNENEVIQENDVDEEDQLQEETEIMEEGESSEKISAEDNLQKSKEQKRDPGIEEGRTLFVRHLPFDVTNDILKVYFSRFGPLKYALVCRYSGTDHSKGTGFIQFLTKEAAQKCLEAANNASESERLCIGNSSLSVCLAVSRSELERLNSEKCVSKKQPKDNRNLKLLEYCEVKDNCGMSAKDAEKRKKIKASNEQKLKNLNIFLSHTRLCVHNIPLKLSDKDLKKLCYEAVSDRKSRIIECRIMRDLNRINSSGIAHSLGYAFVQFTEHEHALKCLKALNNNPKVFTNEKRPIVEFSLENKAVVNLKNQRRVHAKMKQMAVSAGVSEMNPNEVPVGEKAEHKKLSKKERRRKRRYFARKMLFGMQHEKQCGSKNSVVIVIESMAMVKSPSPSKKLVANKERLQLLLEELNQLCTSLASVAEIEEQMLMSEELYRQTDALQVEYEIGLGDAERRVAMMQWAKFRKSFRQSKAQARALISAVHAEEVGSRSTRTAEIERNVQLSRCDVPKFDDNVTKFREFWEQFDTSVHKQADLSDAVMLTYLRSCLSAANADCDEMTARRLQERFDRPITAIRKLTLSLAEISNGEWELEALCDHLHRNVDALAALGKDPRTAELTAAEILITLSREKLPKMTRIKWDEATKADETARSDLTAFMRFIREQTELLVESRHSVRRSSPSKSSTTISTTRKDSPPERHARTGTFLQDSVAHDCPICKGSHKVSVCPNLQKTDRRQRQVLAKKAGLCFICLEVGHLAKSCNRKGGRSKDWKRGDSSTTPHPGKAPCPKEKADRPKKAKAPQSVRANLASIDASIGTRLQTVWAIAHGDEGRIMTVNCLFDSAAERSFIRQDVADELGLKGEAFPVVVHGIGGASNEIQKSRLVDFWLSPLAGEPRYSMKALTMHTLCNDIVLTKISKLTWPHLHTLELPEEEEEVPVHVIIGVDRYFHLIGSTVIRGGENDPVAVETLLGWVICGPLPSSPHRPAVSARCASTDAESCQILRKILELVSLGIHQESEEAQSDMVPKEVELSLSYNGVRYTVCLLLKKANSTLPNRQLAMIRLGSVQTERFTCPGSASSSPDVLMHTPAVDQSVSDWGQLQESLENLWQRMSDVFTYRPLERLVSRTQDPKMGLLKLAASVFDRRDCLAPYAVRTTTKHSMPLPHGDEVEDVISEYS